MAGETKAYISNLQTMLTLYREALYHANQVQSQDAISAISDKIELIQEVMNEHQAFVKELERVATSPAEITRDQISDYITNRKLVLFEKYKEVRFPKN